jgi:hypothetical protein
MLHGWPPTQDGRLASWADTSAGCGGEVFQLQDQDNATGPQSVDLEILVASGKGQEAGQELVG